MEIYKILETARIMEDEEQISVEFLHQIRGRRIALLLSMLNKLDSNRQFSTQSMEGDGLASAIVLITCRRQR